MLLKEFSAKPPLHTRLRNRQQGCRKLIYNSLRPPASSLHLALTEVFVPHIIYTTQEVKPIEELEKITKKLEGIPMKSFIKNTIGNELKKHPEVLFAYLHGSFLKQAVFHDIDVALYLENLPASILEYELKMETEIMAAAGRHIIDVRVLNTAPLSFRYNVIKDGILLLVKDDDKRAAFQEATISAYLDFLPYHKKYLEETLGIEIQQ